MPNSCQCFITTCYPLPFHEWAVVVLLLFSGGGECHFFLHSLNPSSPANMDSNMMNCYLLMNDPAYLSETGKGCMLQEAQIWIGDSGCDRHYFKWQTEDLSKGLLQLRVKVSMSKLESQVIVLVAVTDSTVAGKDSTFFGYPVTDGWWMVILSTWAPK